MPPSQTEGTRWLERAASHGCVAAQTLLTVLCVRGLAGRTKNRSFGDLTGADRLFNVNAPADPDFETALKWAHLAAEAGSSEGQALLGYVLTYGPESMRNLDEADRWYARSAAAQCPQGNLGYALSLARRATDEDGRRRVVAQLRLAAATELPTALYLLGVLTEKGARVPCDPKAAVELYRNAAERRHRSAQLRWGLALIEGRDVERDPVAGKSWLRRAALAGDPQAATLVGNLYVQSGPVPPNYAEAANWYRRAADAGDRTAARALGSLYLTGAGVVRDKEEAARWLRTSAEAGNPAAQVDLANLVLEGVGNPEDPGRIVGWFKQAAAEGDLIAAYNLGVCLVRGVGVDQDDRQRNGCAGLPRELRMRNSCMGACWPRGAEYLPI